MSNQLNTPNRLKVLMLGWEYPPAFTGGLGIATKGLVDAMRKQADIALLLPTALNPEPIDAPIPSEAEALVEAINEAIVQASEPNNEAAGGAEIEVIAIESPLQPYMAYQEPAERYAAPMMAITKDVLQRAAELREKMPAEQQRIYGEDLMEQVDAFTEEAVERASFVKYDIIHANDWMTFPAAMALHEQSGKPLVLHIHSLETDRSTDANVRNPIYDIERKAIEQANLVVAVSEYTKESLLKQYGAEPEKVATVYNGAPIINEDARMNTEEQEQMPYWMNRYEPEQKKRKGKVLFIGRVTAQKGPLTFVRTAKKLLSDGGKAKFTVAGLGDQLEQMMQLAEDERIGHHIDFKGFVKRKKIRKLLKKADLLFMPSVSEPFGLVALEAAQMGLPVVASKQAGVAEVLPGVLTAEHWDSQTFARHIQMLLDYKSLRVGMGKANQEAVARITWDKAADELMKHYQALNSQSQPT